MGGETTTGTQPSTTPNPNRRTTSTTAIVGDLTYIFLNKPDTDSIDWIRFSDPENPTRGTIANIIARLGPISSLVFTDNSIRLYYTGVSEDDEFKDKRVVRELSLPKANVTTTDPTNGWTKPLSPTDNNAKKSELNFEANIFDGTRLLNDISFLSASTKRVGNGLIPVITYLAVGKRGFYTYAWRQVNGDGLSASWKTAQLQLDQ